MIMGINCFPLAEGAAAGNTLAYVKYFFDSVN
jgi:hypothetical protein